MSTVKGARTQGFPVNLDDNGFLTGVVTRRDLLDHTVIGSQTIRDMIKRPPIVVLRRLFLAGNAADHAMVNHDIGRLPVIVRGNPTKLAGIITRSDVLAGFRHRIRESGSAEQSIDVPKLLKSLNLAQK